MPDVPIVTGIVSPMQGQYPVTNTPQANAEGESKPSNAPYAALPVLYAAYTPQPVRNAQRPFITPALGTVQVRRVPISTESSEAAKKVYNGTIKKPKRRVVKSTRQRAFSLFGW